MQGSQNPGWVGYLNAQLVQLPQSPPWTPLRWLAQTEPRNAYVLVIDGKSAHGGQREDANGCSVSCYVVNYEKRKSGLFSQGDHKTCR